MHNKKVIKEIADALESGSKIHLKQSQVLRKLLLNPAPKPKKVVTKRTTKKRKK